MSDSSDMSTPMTRGEFAQFEIRFEQRLAQLATKAELEVWGGALLARIESGEQRLLARLLERIDSSEQRLLAELARHTRASSEDMSAQISVMPYSSGLGGAYKARADRPLPQQYQSADSTARLAALRDIASEVKSTPHQIVFAWLAAKGTLPLVAGSSTQQLSESLDAIDIPLTPEQVKRLDAAGE